MRVFFKKCGENMTGLQNVVPMFVAFVITLLGLALRTSSEYLAARQLTLFVPKSAKTASSYVVLT